MILEAIGVSKSFLGLQALSNVDIQIAEGEIVGLIGPNGAGKTTLFNVISGYLKPTTGDVLFAGDKVTGTRPHRMAHMGMARTFQIVKPLANMTVLENVMVAQFMKGGRTKEVRELAEHVLQQVGLYEQRNQTAGTLTLAGRKRLEVARALAIKPRLILLDEVMAGLNATEVQQTIDLIHLVHKQGITIFIIEHIMHVIMSLSHRVIILNQGEKLCEGRPEEVINDQRVIDAYLGEGFSLA
ncbi:MAG: ABC transporter ATP-binding protein [Clostridiales Family XIII bacterium]|jgi:branched-chain amino acid transport system ATP-binding protein|nr:ABC transporter ATP-binding protein [Clostridiales Family XIII bacterium]